MKLEQKLNRMKNKIGLVGGSLKFRWVTNADHNITAGIDPKDWHINLVINEEFDPVPDRATRSYVKKKNITRPLERICEDIIFHETGHWELPRTSGYGCPYDSSYWDAIVDGIHRGLLEKGKVPNALVTKDGINEDPAENGADPESPSKGDPLSHYVANAFCDIVDNINCKQYTGYTGQVLFWNDAGLNRESKKFTKDYEAFVKLNLFLWGDSIDEKLLKRFYTNDPGVIDAVQTLIQQWGLSKGSDDNLDILFEKDQWNNKAYQYALAIADLIEPAKPQTPLFGSGENVAQRKFSFKSEREKVVHGRYKSGQGPAMHFETFEQLDLLYRKLSKKIPIQVETVTESLQFPVARYGRQRYDPEVHDLAKQRIRGFIVDEDGNLGLTISRGEILTEAGYRRNIRSFPKLKVALLDTSSSMKDDPDGGQDVGSTKFIPWGDKSKYHYALKGWYGIQNYLEQQGFAPYIDNSLVNFSDKTIASGRQAPHNLMEVKKLALSPQFQGTQIDMEVFRSQLEPNSFLMSISDGDIQGWDTIREEYRKAVEGISYAHIQIGSENRFSRDLQSWGIPVQHVRGDEDLSRLMVDVASSHYKDYAFARVGATRSVV